MTHAKSPLTATSLTIDQVFQQAVTCHQAGQIHDAEHLYRTILQTQPNHLDAQHNLGVLTEQIKQAATDLPHFKAALEANTDQAQYWFNYIDALTLTDQTDLAQQILHLGQQQGLPAEMVNTLTKRLEYVTQQSIQLSLGKSASKTKTTLNNKNSSTRNKPNKNSSSHNRKTPTTKQINTLVNLFNTEQHVEAMTSAQQMTEHFPHHYFGWKALGTVLKHMGRTAEALHPLEKAVELSSDNAEALHNLSITYKALGQIDKAETSCQRALQIKPDFATAHNTLGTIQHELGNLNEAEASHRCALKINPNYAAAFNNLGVTLKDMGRFDEAKICCHHALRINPTSAPTYLTLGAVYQDLSQFKEAEANYRHALEIDPNYAVAYNNLGLALRLIGQFDEALASIQHAVEIKPDYTNAYINLGSILQDMFRQDEAETCYRRVLEIKPDNKTANNNLLFNLNYHSDLSSENIYQAYQEYDTKHCIPLRSVWNTHNNDHNPNRRLRIGYVSPDFRQHSCRLFLEPLLAHHDKNQVEIYAYAELAKEDEVTNCYKSYIDHWIPTRGMSDDALAKRIRNDRIDILVELAGHTVGNRLLTFARKPAPVSLSWLGYGYTTGVSAIDYYLTDEACTPANSEALFTEQPWRIATPAYVYRPSPDMGNVSSLPALQHGHITFGTLTRSIRINHRTIRVWSELLKAVPNAQLVIDSADFQSPAMQERLATKFAEHGIARTRLKIGFHTPPWDVLRGIDIGLDCFPHNSGATLWETLYMGVPYITLAGRPSVGRLGSTILRGLQRPEWIAESEADYVAKAVKLASDVINLTEIRARLRDQMENSPLRDEKNFALKVETAYRDMWKKWCQKNHNLDDES